jgi:cytochrome c5
MSGSHDKLPKLFWIQLALVAIVGTIYLTTPSPKGHGEDGASASTVKAAAENLKPIGVVASKDDTVTAGSSAARSGEEVYKAGCFACHDAGVANAPKPSDKAAWEPRVADGLDALVKFAINGKGAMPARGGNPTNTDDDMKAAVLYMTKKAGFDLSSTTGKTEAVPEKKEVEMTEAMPTAVPKTEEVATEAPKVAEAPQAPAAPAAPETPKPAAPTTTETSNPEPVAATATAVASTSTTPADTTAGEKVYKSSCFACHDAGVAGSPKIGDVSAWAARIATGPEALYNSALNGKGVMPPKGGNMGLSDGAVKSAVDYMTAKSQ